MKSAGQPRTSEPALSETQWRRRDQRFKKFEYVYDLVSGNTNQMKYQPNPSTSSGLAVDGFVHKYEYDADNRLQWVSTSRDGLTWDNDAKYYYYIHGPLARMETGEHKVQGCDYAYTIDGNLKGVNSAALDAEKDMGQDGKVTNLTTTPYWSSTYNDMHKWMARDAFSYVLGYFGTGTAATNDYESITAGTSSGNRWLCSVPATGLGDNLFNGNIRHVVLGLMDNTGAAIDNRATAYHYDQLNRIKTASNYLNTGSSYSSILSSTSNGFAESFWYDANGNIDSLRRFNSSETVFDEFGYKYYGNTNRLNYVTDPSANNGTETSDMDGQLANNYAYDEIGQLTSDTKEGITSIGWNVRNKVDTVIKADGTKIFIEYDEMGHRIKKEVHTSSEDHWTQQWYVLDPLGNAVAVYEHKYTNPSGTTYNEIFDLEEHQVYGSDRLGTRQYSNYNLWMASFTCSSFNVDHTFHSPSGKTELDIAASTYQQNKRITGNKYYELKNHTSNVQAVITDYKIPYASCTTGVANVSYYYPNVTTFTDYYAFGMTMPGTRSLNGGNYRYGFNGQEHDKEISGNQNSYTAEFWQYDPRLGRRWNIDPVEKARMSRYSAFGNNPLIMVDPLGASEGWYENEKGDAVYDKNINSQADMDKAGIKGSFISKNAATWINSNTGDMMILHQNGTKQEYTPWLDEVTIYHDMDKKAKDPRDSESWQNTYHLLNKYEHLMAGGVVIGFTGAVAVGGLIATAPMWAPVVGSYGMTGLRIGWNVSKSIGNHFWKSTSFSYFGIKTGMAGTDMITQYGINGKVDVFSAFKYYNPAYGIGLDMAVDVNVSGQGTSLEMITDKSINQIAIEGLSNILGFGASKYVELGILNGVAQGTKTEVMKAIPDQIINGYMMIGGKLIFTNEKNK